MTGVVQGGVALKGEILVPGSVSESTALIALAAFSKSSPSLKNIPEAIGIKTLNEILEKKYEDGVISLDISYDIEPLFAIPPILYRGFSVALNYQNDIPKEFREFIDILLLFNDAKEINKNSYIVKRSSITDKFTIDLKRHGPDAALFSVLLAISHGAFATLLNYPGDPRFLSFLKALEQVGGSILYNDGDNTQSVSVSLQPPFEFSLNTVVSYSLYKAAFFSLAAVATGGAVNLRNVNASEFTPFIAKLLKWGVSVESNQSSELRVWGPLSNKNISDNIEIKSYPGFIPSWGYLALVFLTCFPGNSNLIFPKEYFPQELIKELNRLGGQLDFSLAPGNFCVAIRGQNLKPGRKILLDNREHLLPLLLLSLLIPGRTTFINFEIMRYYYPDVLDLLIRLGAKIEVL